jgi:hypothetical protein
MSGVLESWAFPAGGGTESTKIAASSISQVSTTARLQNFGSLHELAHATERKVESQDYRRLPWP